jgi:hypothetical protein
MTEKIAANATTSMISSSEKPDCRAMNSSIGISPANYSEGLAAASNAPIGTSTM